ncbi:Histone acetyltransferase mcc1 [Orobanche hederae]
MVNLKAPCRPIIAYRTIRPSDFMILQKIHGDLFPVRYESDFFDNVVNGRDIVSWGAVDHSRPNAESDELIGFVTARIVLARESEIEDLLSFDSSKTDQTLVYILTLGVVDFYRNLGVVELVTLMVTYAKSGFKSMTSKLWKNEERKMSKRSKCKEPSSLLPTVQNKKIVTG